MKITRTCILAIILFTNLGCTSGRMLSGYVLDGPMGRPVPDAFVVATWEVCRGIGHCNTFCAAIETVYTSEDGSYMVPNYGDGALRLDVYHPGYLRARRSDAKGFINFVLEGSIVEAIGFASLPPPRYWCVHRKKDARVSAQANRYVLDTYIQRFNGNVSADDLLRWANSIERLEFGYEESRPHQELHGACVLKQSIDISSGNCFSGPTMIRGKADVERMLVPGDPGVSFTDPRTHESNNERQQ